MTNRTRCGDSLTQICQRDGCGKPLRARGVCSTHYAQLRNGVATIRPCAHCGVEFLPARRDGKFCTRVCTKKSWQINNRDLVRSRAAAMYSERRDEILEDRRGYYLRNSDTVRARSAAWYDANRELVSRREAARRASGEPARLERLRRARNPYPRRERENRRRALKALTAVTRITAADVLAKLDYWGHACWMCGGAYEHLDHVKPLALGGSHMLSNLRPACAGCNQSKGAKWFGVAGLQRFIQM